MDYQENELVKILKDINLFENMYEVIRIVDPVEKRVFTYKNKQMKQSQLKCFDSWEKNDFCNNCTSVRALSDGNKHVKIEYSSDKVYIVTAVPVEIDGKKVVVELLMEATNSILMGGKSKEQATEIHHLIDRINNLASIDSLTEVYNRRFINEKLPVDIFNTLLMGKRISIIMADIDYFKKINDAYGHLTGDFVLKSFSRMLASNIKRDCDWLARYGGEEFLICLPGCGFEAAKEIAEDMRSSVEAMDIIYNDTVIKITSSFGVYSEKVDENSSVDSLIEKADRMLYLAKTNGRNRVEL